ncbi:MAG: hypothetical protein RL026_196 [Pseudomonadota bacterium]|jgi:lipopolysaccharide export system permease protein
MRVIDRYIITTVLAAVALVGAVLLVLVGLFLFISEQGDLGGRYDTLAALRYVALNLPDQAMRFLPVFAMIGSLVGLGLLAGGSELTAMRAAGVSILRIGRAVSMAGLLLALLAWVVGEYAAPAMTQAANEAKARARTEGVSLAGRGGAWVRDGQLLLNIRQQRGQDLGGVRVFELAPEGGLSAVIEAEGARPRSEGGWWLERAAASRFSGEGVARERSGEPVALRTRVGTEVLAIATADPRQMPVRSLLALRAHLEANGQDTRRHDFTLWSRLSRIAAVFLAILLGLPFVFGSLRSAGTGARATLGLVIGLAWYMLQRMVESGTLAFGLPPFWLAWLPTLLLAAAVGGLTARLR